MIAMAGCTICREPEPDPVNTIFGSIAGTWKSDEISLEGVIKSEYKDYTITFSTGETSDGLIYFTTTGRPGDCELPESGTLKPGANIYTDLIVNSTPEEILITYASDYSHLELTFLGKWRFKLKK